VDRQQIQFPPKHLALREDVHQLGVLVGEVLRDQGGTELYETVEGDRLAAIDSRGADVLDFQALAVRVAGRAPANARDLVRAFSTWFQAVNLAERVHRIRRRREYFHADGGKVQPGGIEDALAQIKAQGLDLDAVLKLLSGLRIQPILISHPSESTRRTQLRRQQRMAGVLLERLNPNLDPREQRHVWARLRTEVTTGWQTEEHSRQRLTVADEREFAMFHFAEVMYRIVPTFYEEIAAALESLYGVNVSNIEPPIVLDFGTWIGGDMDGAPDVHSKSIRETLSRQQQVIVNEYFAECQQLSQLLSQSASRVPISTDLRRRIDEYGRLFPAARNAVVSRSEQMPYRVFFAQVSERLRQTYDGRANRYERVEQFRADLAVAAESLQSNRGGNAGYQLVRRLLLRVDTFGFHLAKLDLKLAADVHHRVIGQALDDPQWSARPPAEKLHRLNEILERNAGPIAPLDAHSRRTLGVLETATQCKSRFGSRAIGNYIVTGARGPEDVLAALVLARWAGAEDRRSGNVGLDFAPLFDSLVSLRDAGSIMQTLLENRSYREHLAMRAAPQPIYIGHSETVRDGGYLPMRLAAYDAQRKLTQVFKNADQAVALYQARGGSTARGGARLDAMIRATPAEAVQGALRITEQGELIGQNYGLRSNALRTLERAFGVLGLASLASQSGRSVTESAAQHALASRIAARSAGVWQAVMIDDASFYDFFRSVTPIDVIERMQIESRSIWTGSHGAKGALSIRATPWVFAWSQTRTFLTGWFGLGTALREEIASAGLAELQAMYTEWPLWALTVDEVESQLAKTELDITDRYVDLASPGLRHYASLLRTEFQACCDAILAIKQQAQLLDTDRTQQRAIQLRNPYVDPMNLMQVDLLRRWRANGREDDDLFQGLLASVSGIAQGLQTTG
jgi:phosphoenolpyruvate carboxylase